MWHRGFRSKVRVSYVLPVSRLTLWPTEHATVLSISVSLHSYHDDPSITVCQAYYDKIRGYHFLATGIGDEGSDTSMVLWCAEQGACPPSVSGFRAEFKCSAEERFSAWGFHAIYNRALVLVDCRTVGVSRSACRMH